MAPHSPHGTDPTDTTDVLTLYTHHARREMDDSSLRREAAPPVVRYINDDAPHSMILAADLSGMSDTEVGEIAEREKAYFTGIGHEFEWKVYGYDKPENLVEVLRSHGFSIGPAEQVMAIDAARFLDGARSAEGAGAVAGATTGRSVRTSFFDRRLTRHHPCTVGGHFKPRRVEDPAEVEPILTAVQERAFGTFHTDWIGPELARRMKRDPNSLSLFVIEEQGAPVSAAWTLYYGDAPVAGLYGGATVPEYRRRGLYSDLVRARAAEAHTRGVQYLTVDAGPQSRPILEGVGFIRIATTWPATFPPQPAQQ
ncbi:MAG: GNAT family N-acetyltransferase [Spirochaeta sp.]|jgi:GNAT superfamily N-acetyltransferase|nr:GNAT family N-acetyltransferase [Spirochaeta sp.]